MKSVLKRTLGVTAAAFTLATVVGVTPAFASASGCHSSACVKVQGSGVHVDWVQAYSANDTFEGKFKIYAEKANYVKWSPRTTYVNNGTQFTYYRVKVDKNWPNGTDVCVQAFLHGSSSSGTACVTVSK
ncbi:hypothetical protein [Streptomyces sp. NPDC094437]|uniref:hypothetical protein n=1 Tax=Streptomyces sp. NPDC094437 TaxID=3366060 RepID=UPI003827E698